MALPASSSAPAGGRWADAPAAMPRATAAGRIAIRWPGSIPTSGRDMFPLPGVELFQRISRREAFQVKLLQLLNHRVIEWQDPTRHSRSPVLEAVIHLLMEDLAWGL